LDQPDQLKALRETLGDYYAKLKGLSRYISFLFVTGVSRNSILDLSAPINHIIDVSIDSEYGAALGFTQDELEKYFDPWLTESALSLKTSKSQLLKELKAYYNGFSFDGEKRVYNPFSILTFFSKEEKKFDNYWFDTATAKNLVDYMKDKRLTVEEFSGATISRHFARLSPALDRADPMSFLYQAGYLCLRRVPKEVGVKGGPVSKELDALPPVESDRVKFSATTFEYYALDYPNVETRSATSKLALESILGDKVQTENSIARMKAAFDNADVNGVIAEYNGLLARLPYEDYKKRLAKTYARGSTIVDPLELLCRSLLFAWLWGVGLRPSGDLHGRHGRSAIVVPHKGRDFVIELKISSDTVQDDRAKAKEALSQMLTSDYAAGLDNPILLGLVVNEPQRQATTWVTRDGLKGADVWTLPKPPRPAASPPKGSDHPRPKQTRPDPKARPPKAEKL
jgi:hypothetical protein